MKPDIKYREILEQLTNEISGGKPGDRLGSVRGMISRFGTSQSVIDRCLDELERQGRIVRKSRSGTYIAGTTPRSTLIGVYTHGEVAPHANFLFLDGIRSVARERGLQVADFGPEDRYESQSDIFSELDNMGFAGIIAALSTANFVSLESRARVELFRNLEIPIVTCFPIHSVATDSVTPNYYSAFLELGESMRGQIQQPVKFIGHAGIPTLYRLRGLEAGLTEEVPVEVELLHGKSKHAYTRVKELIQEDWEGSLIIGVPPDKPGMIEELVSSQWTEDSPYMLALTIEDGDELPESVHAYRVVRPSYQMGEKAAEMLIERIHGFRGEARYEIIEHSIQSPLEGA